MSRKNPVYNTLKQRYLLCQYSFHYSGTGWSGNNHQIHHIMIQGTQGLTVINFSTPGAKEPRSTLTRVLVSILTFIQAWVGSVQF